VARDGAAQRGLNRVPRRCARATRAGALRAPVRDRANSTRLRALITASIGAARVKVSRVMILPASDPPSDRRASMAVGLAPIFVAVVFTLIVSGLIAFDTGVAIFLACTVWVVYEMMDYQRAVDAYHQQSLQAHPGWLDADPDAQPQPDAGPARMLISARGSLQFEHSRL